MTVRDLLPWARNSGSAPSLTPDDRRNSFSALHREVNRLFDDVLRRFDDGHAPFGAGWPSIEVSETEKEIKVTAELPGLEEKDIEILLDKSVLTLKGERRTEAEGTEKRFSERFYGRFERRIPLPAEVQEDKAEAAFRNGVLSIVLPKTEQARSQARRIAINS